MAGREALSVALGAVLLLIIQNGLTLARVDPLWLQGVYGLVILVAVGVDALVAGQIRLGQKRASRRAGSIALRLGRCSLQC